MLTRTLKLAWYKRDRYALTIVAIALSVAFIISTLLLTTSISDVGEPISDAYAEVDTAIVGQQVLASDGPNAAVTAPVPASVVTELQVAGYEAVGFSSPYAQIIGADGDPSGQAQAASNLAEPWLGTSELNGFAVIDGVGPDGPGQLALDVTTADRAGLAVGDTVSYVTDDGLQQGELVGIVQFGGADNDPYVSTVLLDPADELFAVAQGYDYVLVAGDGTADAVTAEITALLGSDAAGAQSGPTVQTGTVWVDDQIEEINSFLGFFETFLTVFAVIAVVVGLVIVANTFTVSLAQRTEELALLRLVGTTRRQLMQQVVIEALFLGVAGTVLGVIIGLVGSNLLGSFLDFLGLNIERSDTIAPIAIVIGAVTGIGVTVGAAVWPARKATAVAPIEALRSAELEPPSAGRRRTATAIGLLILGAVCLAYGAAQGDIWFTSIGIAGLFFALYVGGELLIKAAARTARPVLAKAGPTGTVASRNLERGAGRTAAAASALMIGVALIGFFTLMAATIGQFIGGDAADGLRTDYVVQGVGNPPAPVLGETVLGAVEATDGVQTVVGISQTSVDLPGMADRAAAPGPDGGLVVAIADVPALQQVYDFEVTAGSLDEVDGALVIVDQSLADELGLTVGDAIPVVGQGGAADLEVAAVVATSLPGAPQPSVIGTPDLATVIGFDRPATTAYVAGAADEAALTDAIGVPTINVMTTDEYVDGLTAGLDTILALVYALLAVAVIIALVGIANTVSLAISERAGEVAAVRAAGASMRQIFWSLISEFGLLALVGVGSGLALAWVSATGFFQALSDGQVTYPETSFTTGVIIAVLGLLGGILAAWIPARSASLADPLDVLRAE